MQTNHKYIIGYCSSKKHYYVSLDHPIKIAIERDIEGVLANYYIFASYSPIFHRFGDNYRVVHVKTTIKYFEEA